MMKQVLRVVMLAVVLAGLAGCTEPAQSVSGTKMAVAGHVETGEGGLTIEQRNINDRIQIDNKADAVKHLYVLSAYTGQVLLYSKVKGKVTSSGKRLTPDHVTRDNKFTFVVAGTVFFTDQVLGEDGTYGSSMEYLYWWDTNDVYHQHYVTGGQVLHISDQPLEGKGGG